MEHDDLTKPSCPPLVVDSPRLKRKKKDISHYRTSAPVQSVAADEPLQLPKAVRPTSLVSLVHAPPTAAARSSPRPVSHARSQSQPRLGHPSRPIYSAIRPNMSPPQSRPSSPHGSPPRVSPTTRPSAFALDEDLEDDTDHPVISLPRRSSSRFRIGFGAFSTPSSESNSGFSVSGEMEMRLALAELAREERARDEQQRKNRFDKEEKGSVGRRVKKIRQGLRDLVRRKP
ncbi:hypothetical protein MKEN_01292900 [Mycena kentingensis (nom. inval.)]|nr:hypothetical protein MKEN_01292900 [Mycena kentingensis (nom. inval.)]